MIDVPQSYAGRFTQPQLDALLWLEPGSSCSGAGRKIAAGLNSLRLFHPQIVEHEWKETPKGRRYLAYSLTELGQNVRDARFAQNSSQTAADRKEPAAPVAKLSSAQASFLADCVGPRGGAAIDRYKPALKLAEMGLIIKVSERFGRRCYEATEAGKAVHAAITAKAEEAAVMQETPGMKL
jgi:DNA-binding PadR family transcriptional regulator